MHALLLASLIAPPVEPAKIEVKAYGPYFESNRSGLKGGSSYLVFSDAKKFGEVLRLPPPLLGGKRPVPVPAEAFKKSHVLVVIKRGGTIYEYSGLKAEANRDTLRFSFKSSAKGAPGSARFATPLAVVVTGGKFKEVEFVENGKKVATVKVD